MALNNLIARKPVFYKKTLFRAFLGLSKKECECMSLQEYREYGVMLTHVLKLWHAPYMTHDEEDETITDED